MAFKNTLNNGVNYVPRTLQYLNEDIEQIVIPGTNVNMLEGIREDEPLASKKFMNVLYNKDPNYESPEGNIFISQEQDLDNIISMSYSNNYSNLDEYNKKPVRKISWKDYKWKVMENKNS